MVLSDWSVVPSDLLEEISKRLVSWDDHVRLRWVCNSWHSALQRRPQVALSLVLYSNSFLSYSLKLSNNFDPNFWDTEFYNPPLLPDETSRGKHICGSSRGWIALCNNSPTPVHLHNPFTGDHVDLPVLPDRCFPIKLVLSSDPVVEPDHCVVIVLCMLQRICLCMPGDACWNLVLCPDSIEVTDAIQDIIFYQGKFYVVSRKYGLYVCHIGPDGTRMVRILWPKNILSNIVTEQWRRPMDPIQDEDEDEDEDVWFGFNHTHPKDLDLTSTFLVVSSAKLLLVTVTYDTHHKESGCEVFRVDLEGGQATLFRMEHLDDRALFLGEKSMSFSLSDDRSLPSWCRGNCIYYAASGDRMVVFKYKDRTIITHRSENCSEKHWLTPTLRR